MTSTLIRQQLPHEGWTNDKFCHAFRGELSSHSDNSSNNSCSSNSNSSSNSSSQQNLKMSSDNSGLKKAIMKMLVLDTENNTNRKNNNSITNFLTPNNNENNNRNMSFLKFFAINALELSAPATPVLLQQANSSSGWVQLSGHPESIAPADNGIVRKRIANLTDSEVIAYRGMSRDIHASKLIPKFLGVCEINGESYIELEDLLHGFKDPNVMDIKMGCRTFSESEVTARILRPDLYKKMIAIDPTAPTEEEHNLKAVTKLRYMMFREQLSSSHTKGFRIEALKTKGFSPVTDLKTLKTDAEVQAVITHFIHKKKHVAKELVKCLRQMRNLIEKSEFFKQHEIIGSSVFIVYDEDHIGAWLIDFAKCRPTPSGIKLDHRKEWEPGNCEEGLLHGMDELINTFEAVCNTNSDNCKIN